MPIALCNGLTFDVSLSCNKHGKYDVIIITYIEGKSSRSSQLCIVSGINVNIKLVILYQHNSNKLLKQQNYCGKN